MARGGKHAVGAHIDTDARLRALVGDPHASVSGTVYEGGVFRDHGNLMITNDRSGRHDVYPWKLPRGPVLGVALLRARQRRLVPFADPKWRPRRPNGATAHRGLFTSTDLPRHPVIDVLKPLRGLAGACGRHNRRVDSSNGFLATTILGSSPVATHMRSVATLVGLPASATMPVDANRLT